MLHAALNRGDPLNQIARNTLDRSPLLSPFSLQETNLLGRAGKLEIRNYDEFAKDLGSLLSAFSIKIINDRPEFHSVARKFESRFRLTFFDSLHAAISKQEGEALASFDRAYDKLEGAGVKRIDPASL